MVRFFNMRAQKPLQYFVGSFEVMNLQSFISVCTCPLLYRVVLIFLCISDFKGGVFLCHATTHSSVVPPVWTFHVVIFIYKYIDVHYERKLFLFFLKLNKTPNSSANTFLLNIPGMSVS